MKQKGPVNYNFVHNGEILFRLKLFDIFLNFGFEKSCQVYENQDFQFLQLNTGDNRVTFRVLVNLPRACINFRTKCQNSSKVWNPLGPIILANFSLAKLKPISQHN